MKEFQSIIQTLKYYLADKKKNKVLDKDVADALGMTQANFATCKKRNSTPFEAILLFCKREKICCEEILFESS